MSRSARSDGPLLIIGGAEDRIGKSSLLRRFVKLAGGRSARVVVIPTASSFQAEVADAYRAIFGRFGVVSTDVVAPNSRAEAGDPALARLIDESTGVFLTGGSQLRLSQYLPGTAVGDAILSAHARGAVIGGTSAGASIQSEFMISLGEEGLTPRRRMSNVSAGLGLITGVVIDQHFAQRVRHGRLFSVIAASPNLIGIGLDEDTAIEVRGSRFEVRGSGGVFVVDCRHAVTDAPDAERGAPLLVSGAMVHSLPAGATFDLATMSLVDFVEMHPDLSVTLAAAKA